MAVLAGIQGAELVGRLRYPGQANENVVDHPVEAHLSAIFGGIDLFDPVALQRLDLVGGDCAATTDDDSYVRTATLLEHVHHILEIFIMSALVGAYGDPVGILLDSGANDVRYAAV